LRDRVDDRVRDVVGFQDFADLLAVLLRRLDHQRVLVRKLLDPVIAPSGKDNRIPLARKRLRGRLANPGRRGSDPFPCSRVNK
jgi:hypothetical protein